MNRLFRLALLPSVLCAAIVAVAVGQPPVAVEQYGRGYVEPPNAQALKTGLAAAHADAIATLPTATETVFDLTSFMPSVKAQGSCGSCWDFAGTGIVEGALARAGKRLTLSEQYTLSCVSGHGGCNGDWHATVLKAAKSRGLPTTDDYGPYEGRESRCKAREDMAFYKIDDWGFVSGDDGVAPTQKIKDAMKAYGPIAVAVAAGNSWNGYSGGVHRGNNRNVNHAVILVGWDDTKLRGRTVWRMRNSWGERWGDKGHMWIEEGADRIGYSAAFAVVKAPEPPVPPPPGPVEPFDWRAFVVGVMTGLIIAGAVVFVASRRKA